LPQSSSDSTGFLCFGFFRKFFGTMTLAAGTVPTRSRAMALTDFFTLYLLSFFGKLFHPRTG
jgi:hypothetical protein